MPGDYSYLEIGWCVVSALMFLVWAYKHNWGRTVFADAPLRKHNLSFADVIGVIFIFLLISMVSVLAKESLKDSPILKDSALTPEVVSLLVFLVGQVAMIVLVVRIAGRRFEGAVRGWGLDFRHPLRTILKSIKYSIASFGLVFLMLAFTVLISRYCGYTQVQQHSFLKEIESHPSALELVLLAVLPVLVAPVLEEMIFRGILQNFIVGGVVYVHRVARGERAVGPSGDKISPYFRWWAIILTSVFFALTHDNWQH